MSDTTTGPSAPGDEAEFRAIEATFGQTARGRWFLAEYARRRRGAETDLVLAAIRRLEERLDVQRPAAQAEPPHQALQQIEAVRTSLAAMLAAIAGDAREAAAIRHPVKGAGEFTGLDGLGHVADDLGAAISAVLDAAEHIQEIAWTLRERGAEGAACDRLDQRASEIYAACAGEDAALKRLRVLLHSVGIVDRHLAALGEALQIAPDSSSVSPAAPATTGAVSELDFALIPDGGAEPVEALTAAADAEGSLPAPQEDEDFERRQRERLAILAEIDGLGLHEKLKLFT